MASIEVNVGLSEEQSMKRQMMVVRGAMFMSLVVLATAGLPARAQYAGGSGTADDPYLVTTAEQLNAIGFREEDWSKHFRLTADIDMNDLGETPVNLIPNFKGVFDGNDHTIANLTYLVKDDDSPPEMPYVWCIGLFRIVGGVDALVKDLGLIDPDVRPDPNCTRQVRSVGTLVGMLSQGWVRNCYVEGGKVLGYNSVGGLVGECRDDGAVSDSWSSAEVSGENGIGGVVGGGHFMASIWLCHARGRVSGRANIGGLVGGWSKDCMIEDCFTTGIVTGNQAGGLVGNLAGRVSHCYSTASVSGGSILGGLAGINSGLIRTSWAGGEVAGGSTAGGLVGWSMIGDGFFVPFFDTTVADCYTIGAVRGENVVGGLIGHNAGTVLRCYARGAVAKSRGSAIAGGLVAMDDFVPEWDVRGCFWDMTTSGVEVSDGGTGLTTAQMQDAAVYLDVGWDFVGETANGTEDLWKMSVAEPSYPKLAWEPAPADDPTDPNGID